MKRVLKKVSNLVRAHLRILVAWKWPHTAFLAEVSDFLMRLNKYNASVDTDADRVKMEYTLLRETHVIEKGMSLRSPKIGFGKQKVEALLGRLHTYWVRYGAQNRDFIRGPLDTIASYLSYMDETHVEVEGIRERFNKLVSMIGVEPYGGRGGVKTVSAEDVRAATRGDFLSLARSRHSIRYFDPGKIPSEEEMKKALEVAQYTPSACNRQAWHVHVYRGSRCLELLQWQSGCRGFEDEVKCALLVTADMKGFLSYEVHQAYVDGGLYAMNLIHALHYVGLGTIPLSTGFECQKLRRLSAFGVPENEVPIVIIGGGCLPAQLNVAVSARKSIDETTTWHEGE